MVKRPVEGTVKVDAYAVMCMAVEVGVLRGWNRAHKHGEPSPEDIREHMEREVLTEICEWFRFGEDAT